MKKLAMRLPQSLKLSLVLSLLILGCSPAWADDVGINLFYTQYGFAGISPAVGTIHLQYTFSSNSLVLSGNTVVISGASDSGFGGADGILINSNNNDLLVAGGGGEGAAGIIYQVTQAGAEGTPFSVTMTPATTTYTLTVVPANGSKSGFSGGTLVSTEKDFGYGHITVFPLSPALSNGIAYPVTGDDIYVTSIAFTPDGTAYYGSGTETSDAGNFGTVTFDGTEFVTHRLFGQPVGSDPRGGVIFAGTHRLSFDPYTNDIFTAGGDTVGQYDPVANVFHVLSLYGPQTSFEFSTPINDGQGHALVTDDAHGDLVIIDYSSAPNHLIDASSGVQYTYGFVATNLSGIVVASSNNNSGPPVITQQPQNTSAIVGQAASFSVAAAGAGLTYQWESEPSGGSAFAPIPGATSSTYTTPPVVLTDNGAQFLCVVSNSQGSPSSSAASLTVFSTSTNYVTSASPGSRRNNFTGWVGMSISVGNSPLTVTALGRMFAAGNTGAHIVKIVNAKSGSDVSGGSVSIPMSGGTVGNFVYGNLPVSVTLTANTSYYILSQETAAGDAWSDLGSIQTTAVASDASGAWSSDGATYNVAGLANQEYVPVDFQYAVNLSQPTVTQQPQSVTVSAGASATFSVTATGGSLNYQWESEAPGGSSFSPISGATASSYTVSGTTVLQSGTQYMCVVTNTVNSVSSSAATLTVIASVPSTNYVTSTSLGAQRNNFTGWVGMSITVGGSPVTVSALGRMFAPGDTHPHIVKIVNASNSQDVSGGSVTIPTAGGTAGTFLYATLPASVTLNANATYYIVSQETGAGDTWYDLSSIQTTSVAAETTGVWSPDGATYNFYGAANQEYVPVDFQYVFTVSQPTITQQPQSISVTAGSAATFSVTATGGNLSYQWQSEAPGGSTFSPISGATASSYTVSGTVLSQSGTQYMCVVTNTANSVSSSAATLTVVASLPGTNYVTSTTLGAQRNNFSGWVGMSITVGSSPVTVSALGRMVAPGDASPHTVKIVSAANSQDVSGGSVSIPTAGGTAGSFVYAGLASSVTLNAGATYYVVSQETAAGDMWYDLSSIQTSSVASDTTGVWSPDGATYNFYGAANQAYVPVDLKYTVSIAQPAIAQQPQSTSVSVGVPATFSVTATGGNLTYQWKSEAPGGSSFAPIPGATGSSYTVTGTTLAQSGTQYMCVVTNTAGSATSNAATLTVVAGTPGGNYVTSVSPGTLRNDFTGWVGMSIAVGGSAETVSGLGRMSAPGNTGTHTVKIVTASNGQDVVGGSVSIPVSGGTAGSFVYANLPAAVTLNANTTYYIVSQETQGSDQWYDVNTTVQTTGVASETGGVWSINGATYSLNGTAGHSYVPVDFQYTVSAPIIVQQPQSKTVNAGASATFSVTATGGNLGYQWQSEAPGGSSFAPIPGATASSYTVPVTTLGQSGTQYMVVVTNPVNSATSSAATLTVVPSLPTTNYVISTTVATQRNDFNGWVGMSITVGASPVIAEGLGRMFATGNSHTHTVKIVNASNSQDVSGASVSVSMAGGTVGSFVYASFQAGVTLSANTTYYIVSQETAAGDTWGDISPIQTTNVASETTGVWSPNGATYNLFGAPNQSYVPVDLVYAVP